MAYLDNPAGRLHSAFEAARTLPPNTPAIQGWAAILEVDQKDLATFFERVAGLLRLAKDTREQISNLVDDDPETLLSHFPEIEGALANFPSVTNVNMQNFLAPVSPAGDYCLKICSSVLHRRNPERDLPEETTQDLKSKVDELIKAVLDSSDLDPNIQNWLLDRLHEIRRVLLNPKVYSARDLQVATEKIAGGLIFERKRAAKLRDSRLLQTLFGLITALDLALNIGANYHELTSSDKPPQSQVVIDIQQVVGQPLALPAASAVNHKGSAHSPS